MLERDSSIPLHRQIRQYLEKKIDSGEWAPGYQIPTEKELASLFEVSTITVKRAILDLVQSGKLFRISGKGTFVNKIEETNLSKLVSIQDKLGKEKSYPHKTLSFEVINPGKSIAEIMEINEKDKVYYISRIKLDNEKPIVIENSWVNQSLITDLKWEDLEDKLLYNIFIKKYGLNLKKAKVYISSKVAEQSEAVLLNVPIGEQLLIMDRITTTEKDDVVEYSRFITVSNEFKYYLEIDL
ncbi:GntR family transcriptional regulator [Compostibacillus humi]|uniref:GntR family transcriptional regulator n=1 Tax=Compostibacillus humi TaxID=1245525 RepID=A0A8J2TPS5_9BACI|nr:GntR family transcriptional regulator [Compostibacillus humi]GFZ87484.1 GntR family transcriptional regulator [Compostibacillus humi]